MANKRTARDPAALERKKIARRNFRMLVLKVKINRLWLSDLDEQKISLNAKRNVAIMVRQQGNAGTLTSAEKTLLNSHPIWRTVQDRKKLVTLLTGLPCFSKITPKVRARLAKVVKLLYLGPGRTIMRQGNEALSVYFIITGQVEVSKTVYDPMQNEFVKEIVFLNGPGDCIGDIEMIEGIPRMNTYVTANNVELLYIGEEDFDEILRPELETQWLNKKKVLFTLGYFNHFNEHQIIQACRFSQLKEFDPLETIYHEDNGLLSDVHFVISGECMILQCLKMKVQYKNGNKMFELVEQGHHHKADTRVNIHVTDKIDAMESRMEQNRRLTPTTDIKNIEILCGLRDAESDSIHTIDLDTDHGNVSEREEMEGLSTPYDDDTYKTDSEYHSMRAPSHMSILSLLKQPKQSLSLNKHLLSDEDESEASSGDEALVKLFNEFNQKKEVSQMFKLGRGERNIENHFIDVGSLTFGGIFGLGEELQQRVIMARTTVQCLLIPRYWLLEKDQNPGNLWQRKKFYLNSTIPSRLKLYQNFLTTQKWQKFKDNVVQTQMGVYTQITPTKPQDIPVILHILEEDQEN